MATTSAQVQQLYVAYLGRAADKGGLDYWLGQLNAEPATITLDQIRANFVNEQPEYAATYANLSRVDTVTKVYNNLFGRAPDAGGLAYWTTGGGSTVAIDDLLVAFVNGAAATDAQTITNKVLVSEVYTAAVGTNYTKADAVAVLSGVNSTSASVAAAVAKLENGGLSGVAVPAGVAALKADALADKAVVDFKAAKVAELVALNKEVVDLQTKGGVTVTLDALVTPTAPAVQTYADVDQALTNATKLRDAIGGATSVLKATSEQATTELAAARDAYTQAATGNVDKAVAYEKAVVANAALTKADSAAVTTATNKTDVDFSAAAGATGGTAALAKANTDAGLTGGAAVSDAASLYLALTDKTASATKIAAITKAFDTFIGTSTDYTSLKALAATDYAKAVAAEAVVTTSAAITGTGAATYLSETSQKAAADKAYANAVAADALVAKAGVVTTALTALEKVAADTTVPSYVKDLAANSAGVTDVADLFHFAGNKVVEGNDFAITSFAKGDAIYVGEGYTLNTTATFDATANQYTGSSTSALEVFFGKNAGGDVTITVEANAVGNVAAAGTTDNVSVITLTGITDAAQVTFANGIVSHV